MSESHDEVLEWWHRERAEARLRAYARQQASRRIRAVPPICRNPALQTVGAKELTEEEQDNEDRRFLQGRYAPKNTHVSICSFYKPYQLEQPVVDPAAAQVEMRRRLWGMSSGEHIRLLRKVLGWTQEQAAAALRISRRSIIRHEQGRHLRPWMRNSLEMRLRQLEADHAEQLAAHLAR
jgi:DNA-binding XRE family transcriptional regulator